METGFGPPFSLMPDQPMQAPTRKSPTVLAVIALFAGFGLGALARETGADWLLSFAAIAKPAGTLWTNTLRMIVLPLMISYLVLAISSLPRGRTAGVLGITSLVSFVTLLGIAGLFSVLVTPSLLANLPIAHSDIASFAASAGAPAEAAPAAAATAPSVSQWISSLVPTNIVHAIIDDNYLQVFIAAILLAAAMSRIATERRAVLVNIFQAVADTATVLVGWLIRLLPLAAFCLAFVSGAAKGLTVAGNVGVFILTSSAILIVATILMYPIAMIVGKVSLRSFASAVAPAQTVAAGTRSSLACLPALVEAAEQELGMRADVAAFTLPFSVSVFKLNLVLSQPLHLFFVATMFGMHLTPAFMLSFTASMILISFTTAGIPNGGSFTSLPFYLALGIPIEAFALFRVADAIPDIFKTVLNVTADMTVATIVARFASREDPAATIRLTESGLLAAET
jgi:Na+/H+-dicarboxylate symporter